jgi:alpha-L-fucosidase
MKIFLVVPCAVASVLLSVSLRADSTGTTTYGPTLAEKAFPNPVPQVDGNYKPSWDSLEQYQTPDWFRDAKFGIWAHWGPQCQPGQGDWYARNMYSQFGKDGKPNHDYEWQVAHYGHPTKAGFKEVIHDWKAEKFDPNTLMALYKAAGAKYFMALGDHHDNFDTWNSKYQPWNSVNIGPHQDLIKGWAAAARANGLRFGVSIHAARAWSWYEVTRNSDSEGPLKGVAYDGTVTVADGKGQWWDGLDPQDLYAQNHPLGAKPDEAYKIKMYNRLMDLVTNYKPDLVYFDDSGLPLDDWGLKFAANYYNLNEQWHGGKNEAVINAKKLSDQQRKCIVMDIERGKSGEILPQPWQTDTCIGQWHYSVGLFEHHGYKKASEIIPMLIDIVSKNGNLMLNIPLRGDGTPDSDEIGVLQDLAAWMKVNSGGIFATRPWKVYGEGPSTQPDPSDAGHFGGQKDVSKKPFTAADIRYLASKDGATLFAYFLAAPADHTLTLTALAKGEPVSGVKLLGSDAALVWTQDAAGLHVTLPADYTALQNVGGLKIALK